MTAPFNRFDLQQLQGMSPKLLRGLEQLFIDTADAKETSAGTATATGAIQNATVITLSSNAAFNNERVLSLDPDSFAVTDEGAGGRLLVQLLNAIILNGAFRCTLNLEADTNLDLPSEGRVPSSSDGPYADDAAAAAAGVQVGEWYAKTSGAVVWRQA